MRSLTVLPHIKIHKCYCLHTYTYIRNSRPTCALIIRAIIQRIQNANATRKIHYRQTAERTNCELHIKIQMRNHTFLTDAHNRIHMHILQAAWLAYVYV